MRMIANSSDIYLLSKCSSSVRD